MRKNIDETRGRKNSLSDEQKLEIRKSKSSIPELAREYGVSTALIYNAFKTRNTVA